MKTLINRSKFNHITELSFLVSYTPDLFQYHKLQKSYVNNALISHAALTLVKHNTGMLDQQHIKYCGNDNKIKTYKH